MLHEIILRTEALTKSFQVGVWNQPVKAVEDLDLEVWKGEVFGFLGPNGAGKTTTMKMLVGLIYPTSGKAWIFGREVSDMSARRLVGFLPEMPCFYDYLTAEEFLRFHGKLCGLWRHTLKNRIEALLDLVGLADVRYLKLRWFSKGMLQRIGIAQALMNDPQLVILDEPMSGLDPLGRKQIRDLILSLKDQGRTIFLSSHLLHEMELICDRVGILVNGRLMAAGRVAEFLASWSTQNIELVVKGLDSEGIDCARKIAQHVITKRDHVLLVLQDQEDVNEVIDIIRSRKASVLALTHQKKSLETFYMTEVQQRRLAGSCQ
jgi:ABC-2 type transport system ATP-binding protein